MGFFEEQHRGKEPFHHIISRVHTVSVASTVEADLEHLAETVFVTFLYCKATLPPLSILYSLGESP